MMNILFVVGWMPALLHDIWLANEVVDDRPLIVAKPWDVETISRKAHEVVNIYQIIARQR